MISPLFMNPTYLTIVGVLTFLVIISIYDANVPLYLWLRLKLLWIQIKTFPLVFWFHPRNPLYGWMMKRRFQKVIREMAKKAEKRKTELLNKEQ